MPLPIDTAVPMRRRHALGFGLASLGATWAPLTLAQPGGPVGRIVLGFPAGSGGDRFCRALAENMRGAVSSNMIVENRAGAGGRLAVEAVKGAQADGNTLLFTPAGPIVMFPHIFKKLTYDPIRDLQPVSTAYALQVGLAVGPGAGAKSLAEYVAASKSDPGKGTYGSPGLGTLPHFVAAMFGRSAGLDLTHVAYRGLNPLVQDVVAGHVPAAALPIGMDAVERHRSGQLRILAIADTKRMRQLPDVPTFTELGYRELVFKDWFGIFAPAGTPSATVELLSRRVREALTKPEVMAYLDSALSEPMPSTPAELSQQVREEFVKWQHIVKTIGFTPTE